MGKPARYQGDTFIYFIGPLDRSQGVVKIGKTSKAVEKRLATIQTGSPHRLSIYGRVEMDGRYEEALHRLFAAQRLHGEWFRLTGHLKALIDDLTSVFLGPEWDDDSFWDVAFKVFKNHSTAPAASPQSLAYMDKRILSIFPLEGHAQ